MGFSSFCLIFLAILSTRLYAAVPFYSQSRRPSESYQQAKERFLNAMPEHVNRSESALAMAQPLGKWDFTVVPNWGSKNIIEERFRAVRDHQFLVAGETAFLRRISWLYPDDGCFARAAMVRRLAEQWGYSMPHRIFVFGSLHAKTENHQSGSVDWWYHTASVVRAGNQAYVLDAALDSHRALGVREWILGQVDKVADVTVSICDPYTYNSSSPCTDADEDAEDLADIDQKSYLTSEYFRQQDLGRDPERVLGDEPPWDNTTP